jgi:hypothetical protein
MMLILAAAGRNFDLMSAHHRPRHPSAGFVPYLARPLRRLPPAGDPPMKTEFSLWTFSITVRWILCLLTVGTPVIPPAHAEESWTQVMITQVNRAEEAIGATYPLSCVGTRCRGSISLEVAGVFYRFEAMALFSPQEVRIAIEPVPGENGQLIHLHKNSFDPIVLSVGQSAVASKIVALVEVTQPEKRPLVRQPVVRWGVAAKIRIDVRAPTSDPPRPVPLNPI